MVHGHMWREYLDQKVTVIIDQVGLPNCQDMVSRQDPVVIWLLCHMDNDICINVHFKPDMLVKFM